MKTRSAPLAACSLLLALAPALTTACSSDPEGSSGPTTSSSSSSSASGTSSGAGGGTSSSTAGPSSGSGTGGEAPSCPPGPGFGGGETSLAVDTVSALVVDEQGQGVPGLDVQVCGLDVCLLGETAADGSVTVAPAGMSIEKPVFKYGDALTYPRFGVVIEQGSVDLGPVVTSKLPATGAPLTPGGDVTSGDVTLTIAPDAVVEIDQLVYEAPETQGFRAVAIADIAGVPAVDPALGLELLYGVAPLETRICPAATVTIPNDKGWAPGAEVELWIHGLDISQGHAPYGGWAKASDGAVSADGATISTSAGQGLPVLTAFGVKLK